MRNRKLNFLLKDGVFIAASIGVAVVIVRSGLVGTLLTSTKELEIIGSFVAGMFFTSVLTTAPAIVTLGEMARANSIVLVAFFGALGAVVGDLIIFHFIRDRLSEHLLQLFQHQRGRRRLPVLFRLKYFRWLTFLVAGMIIASPLPDELGIGLLGFSKTRTSWFIALSFVFNFLGIVLIGLIAKSL